MLPAQVHKVDPKRTITFEVPGATAAFSMDAFFVEATAENGVVSVEGKQPGTTHIVVITSSGPQTFEILVTQPPPKYPPGFVMPISVADLAQSGYYEGRYYSSPSQIQSQLDFVKIRGDNRTHVHLVETNLLGPLDAGYPRIALSSATYQVVTARRDITLFDQYVDESQLTINGSIVRGFHMRQDNWFVHAGYTSIAAFEGLFLPVQPELVMGGGYQQPLTESSSLTASAYNIRIPRSDLLGHSGYVGTLRYKYRPRENFWFTTDLGISHGVGGAGQLFYRSDRDNITGLARYLPLGFASLGANTFRGVHTDFAWNRHVTKCFDAGLTFYNNNLVLPNLREKTISGAINLRYQVAQHWAVTGGAIMSRFETIGPASLTLRSFTLPVGLDFHSKHLGGAVQYQFAATPGRDSGGKQIRASLHSGWGAFTVTGFAERDTNSPTLSFIYSQVAGLQLLLEQQGIRATTVQQVDEVLSSNAFLIAAGYVKGASINLVPVRTQLGGTLDWSSRGVQHRKQVSYSVLFNDNQTLQGSTEETAHTLSYSQRVTRADEVSLACSILGVKNPGQSQVYAPVCFIAWRHQFQHVPYFIVPERHGTIAGNVFRDDQSAGAFEPGMPPMPEVELLLDGRRRTLSHADGSYRFPGVAHGKHRIVVKYESKDPFFFTTPSDLDADEDATVNFGIGYSLSGLMGRVLNDAGAGIAGVIVTVRSRGKKWTATTEADGSFFVASLVAGDYDAQADEDSLPPGYSADALGEAQLVTVGAAAPGKAAFNARALRSVSGRVLRYDTKVSQYVPVVRALVTLQPGATALTDPLGRYLFRDLAAGTYKVSVPNEAPRTVRLGAQPVTMANVDFQMSKSDERDATVVGPAVSPVPPVSTPAQRLEPALSADGRPVMDRSHLDALPAASAASQIPPVKVENPLPQKPPAPAAHRLKPVLPNRAAQQHNNRGRELAKSGHYREAIVELTEALRIAPDFALAFNARGFARMMLHDCASAIDDLNQAIRLNPRYGDAYKIRAIARRSIGDASGAAADSQKSHQLAH